MLDSGYTEIDDEKLAAANKRDTEIALQIEQGSAQAEDTFYRTYEKGLRLMLLARSRCASKADDVTHEAFIVSIQRIRQGDLRDHSRLRSFLYSTAQNILRDHFRKEERFTAWNPELDTRAEEESASSIIYNDQRNKIVSRIIKELPTERDRIILTKYYLEEADRDALCKQLDIDSVHFSRVIFRAKQRLKVLLSNENLLNFTSE